MLKKNDPGIHRAFTSDLYLWVDLTVTSIVVASELRNKYLCKSYSPLKGEICTFHLDTPNKGSNSHRGEWSSNNVPPQVEHAQSLEISLELCLFRQWLHMNINVSWICKKCSLNMQMMKWKKKRSYRFKMFRPNFRWQMESFNQKLNSQLESWIGPRGESSLYPRQQWCWNALIRSYYSTAHITWT